MYRDIKNKLVNIIYEYCHNYEDDLCKGCMLEADCERINGDFEHHEDVAIVAASKVMAHNIEQQEKKAQEEQEALEQQELQQGTYKLEEEQVNDPVNHPAHYTHGGMECIDEMVLVFGTNVVMNFCLCNAWKYRKRAMYKNGEEDMKKADWYLNKYRELDMSRRNDY